MSSIGDSLLIQYASKKLLLYTKKTLFGPGDSIDIPTYQTKFLEPHNNEPISSEDYETVSVNQDTIKILSEFEIYIIDSVKSGKPKKNCFYEEVLKHIFTFIGLHNQTYLQTSSAESIGTFASLMKQKSSDSSKLLLLFLSGDTVIFEFINYFYYIYPSTESPPPTYILPFPHGTGNALANSIKLYTDLSSVQALLQFQPVHLPIYQLKTQNTFTSVNKSLSSLIFNPSILFLLVASWGLHSNLVYESDKPKMRTKYGAERFKIAAQSVLAENRIFKGCIQIDESHYATFNSKYNKWEFTAQQTYQNLSYCLLTSVSDLEKNFKISPDSKTSQDLLHLIAIPYVDSEKVMKLMYDAYNHGAHIKDSLVLYKPLKSLSLNIQSSDFDNFNIICLDGSSWQLSGTSRNLNFSVLQQSFLHILT